MDKQKILKTKSSIVYIFRNKTTGDFVDENFDLTTDISEAVGYYEYNKALDYIKEFDEPEDWYIVTKITNTIVVGEPVEVKRFI